MKRLIVFSGIPGSGKSTLSKMYADNSEAIRLSVDPIEGAMKLAGIENNDNLGRAAYKVMGVIADQQLSLHKAVIIDAVNPVEEARDIWRELAKQHGIQLEVVECITKDRSIHKQRVEKLVRNIPGMKEISWERVQFRKSEYQPWKDERIIIQTDGSVEESYKELITLLSHSSD